MIHIISFINWWGKWESNPPIEIYKTSGMLPASLLPRYKPTIYRRQYRASPVMRWDPAPYFIDQKDIMIFLFSSLIYVRVKEDHALLLCSLLHLQIYQILFLKVLDILYQNKAHYLKNI